MHIRADLVLAVLLGVLADPKRGTVGAETQKHEHRHHKTPPRFASWQEKGERAAKHPKGPGNTAGEMRGIYFVVDLDKSPPPRIQEQSPPKKHTANVRVKRVRRAAVPEKSDGSGGGGGGVAPTITSLLVQSDIANRFATTHVTSVIQNAGNVDSEASFVVQIPEKAFISNFTMLINDKLFVGQVKEKEVAEKEYEEAKKRKETAGKVSAAPRSTVQPARGMEVFSVAVNIAASSSVEFVLTYQQLLERKLGVYTQVISVRPNQVVKGLRVVVSIVDSQDIEFVKVTMKDRDTTPNDTLIKQVDSQTKKVIYTPTEMTQAKMDPQKGLNGDLKISYDVTHAAQDAGLVCVDDEYFIHYFSPVGLDPLNKNVVFVIDTSGSMAGNKIEQTLKAMLAILDILRSGDRFKFILFDTNLRYWPRQQGLIPANLDNIYSAKKFLHGELKAEGSTNINDALVEACRTLNTEPQRGSNIIVFLTDGQPTAGETMPEKIVSHVVKEAGNRVSVFSLGFGNKYELDFNLLKKISYRTGVMEGAIRIYPGLEADEQLTQFFAIVNTPLLYNIRIQYPLNLVIIDTVTQSEFPQYFNGSELVIAGKLHPNSVGKHMTVVVEGFSTTEMKFRKDVDLGAQCPVVSRGYAQKLYAYMKVKYLLIQAEKTDSPSVQQQIRKDALVLALDYNLVTPLTSMVIIQRAPDVGNFYGEEDAGIMLSKAFSSRGAAEPVAKLSQANIFALLVAGTLSWLAL